MTNAWGLIKKKLIEWEKKDRKDRGLPSEDEAEATAATAATSAEQADGDTNPSPKKRARTTKAAGTPKTPKAAATPKAASATKAGRPRSTPVKKSGARKGKGGGILAGAVPAVGNREDDDEDIALLEAGVIKTEIADGDETEDDDEAKIKAGMIKLEREVDENGVESFVSGEI